VANSSIAYLLNEYSASQEALKNILDVDEVPTYYITELSTKSNGRPDVTGLDKNGHKSIIIEGKFWANLTDNQPNNYLKELGDSGRLLFLAPDKRIGSLELDIEKRLNGKNDKVVICSWKNFLELIEKENNKNHNHHLASDLIQIKELCQKMDTEGMPPLSLSDLDSMNGRVATQFSDVVDECNPIIRKWNEADFKGLTSSSSKYGYGFYFKAYGITCRLYFSSHDWFIRDSHTPIWLNLYRDNIDNFQNVYHTIYNFDSNNTYNDKDFVIYGIQLQPGMDKNQVVNHIVNKVKEVLEYLNSKSL